MSLAFEVQINVGQTYFVNTCTSKTEKKHKKQSASTFRVILENIHNKNEPIGHNQSQGRILSITEMRVGVEVIISAGFIIFIIEGLAGFTRGVFNDSV